MANGNGHSYEFGPFRLDPAQRLFSHDGAPVRLAPKTFELLLFFICNSNEVLEKETLMREVWPDAFVEDANLTVHISSLRKALSADIDASAMIETFPKVGYRFTADVREFVNGDHEELGRNGRAQGNGNLAAAVMPVGAIVEHPEDGIYSKKRTAGLASSWRVALGVLVGTILVATAGLVLYRYFNPFGAKTLP